MSHAVCVVEPHCRSIEINQGVLLLLSMESLKPLALGGIFPIGGDDKKFDRIHRLIVSGTPLEPVHIHCVKARKASPGEQEVIELELMPELLGFGDGRHRFSFLLEHGWRTIFACVPTRQADWFASHISKDPNPDCILVDNPAVVDETFSTQGSSFNAS